MYMDISGIPPQKLLEYFPRIEEIADKVLWGTDWPAPGVTSLRKNIDEFRALNYGAEVERKVFWENAARLFPK
jgi:predicted TIM-barrel fold metal-dependent hydrolase